MPKQPHVKRLGFADLSWLLSESGDLRVSIYLPMEPPGQDARVNRTRLKNALRECESRLSNRGVDQRQRQRYLEEFEAMVGDPEVWQSADRGLAAFTDGEELRLRSSPMPWKEMISVGYHYQILPAIPLCQTPRKTLILTLSQKQVRLIAVTRFYAEELSLEGVVPTSLEESAGHDTDEQHLQFHTPARDASPIYHAQGGGKDDLEPELERFCRGVGRGVASYLRGNGACALILAGDVGLTSIYNRVARHDVAAVVNGNFDQTPVQEIEALARERLSRMHEQALDEMSARYASLKARAGGSADENDILAAARDGRIGELLVKGSSAPIELPSRARPADGHSNLACIATLKFGGNVHFVPGERFPERGTDVAALYRY